MLLAWDAKLNVNDKTNINKFIKQENFLSVLIILLTEMLSQRDLGFYDFSTDGPVRTWQEQRSE